MDYNAYFLEWLVRERLAEARAAAARYALTDSLRAPRCSARVWLGNALIRVGHRVLNADPVRPYPKKPLAFNP